jgi:hypothetical protein
VGRKRGAEPNTGAEQEPNKLTLGPISLAVALAVWHRGAGVHVEIYVRMRGDCERHNCALGRLEGGSMATAPGCPGQGGGAGTRRGPRSQ